MQSDDTQSGLILGSPRLHYVATLVHTSSLVAPRSTTLAPSEHRRTCFLLGLLAAPSARISAHLCSLSFDVPRESVTTIVIPLGFRESKLKREETSLAIDLTIPSSFAAQPSPGAGELFIPMQASENSRRQ